jgi:diaminopimelate epimerase
MKKINFTKMQSLGNDFVVIDQIKSTTLLSKKLIKKISDRNYGIGCDQVLILEKSNKKDIFFKYKIYNKDGSESGQCGNGAKCIAKYYFDTYGKRKKNIQIETITNKMSLNFIKENLYEVDMGVPSFKHKDLNINEKNYQFKENSDINNHFNYKGKKYHYKLVSVGNPHAVFMCKGIERVNLEDFSMNFNKQNIFLKGVNISIVENIKKNHWLARIYERGSGETKACGSAACAISACLKFFKNTQSKNNYIHMQGGKAQVKWSGKKLESVYLLGTASYVFNGTYNI